MLHHKYSRKPKDTGSFMVIFVWLSDLFYDYATYRDKNSFRGEGFGFCYEISASETHQVSTK
jgi:hypothetical protein